MLSRTSDRRAPWRTHAQFVGDGSASRCLQSVCRTNYTNVGWIFSQFSSEWIFYWNNLCVQCCNVPLTRSSLRISSYRSHISRVTSQFHCEPSYLSMSVRFPSLSGTIRMLSIKITILEMEKKNLCNFSSRECFLKSTIINTIVSRDETTKLRI